MDFRYDDDERTLLDEARHSLRSFLPRERFFHGSTAVGNWEAVAEGGWLHALLPEHVGGAELPLHLVAGIAKEAGALLAGDAFVNNAVIVPRLLAASTRSEDLLARHGVPAAFVVADGRTRFLNAGDPPTTRWCYGVEEGFAAYVVGPTGLRLHDADTFSFTPLGEVALGVGEVTLRGDGKPIELAADLRAVHVEALVAHAATVVGLGEAALADTRDYTLGRHQFGGPIGRFQAIKHELADIVAELEIAWNAVLYASLRPDDASVLIALLQAARASIRAGRAMVQFFGGIGVTIEHHAHLFLKTAGTTSLRFGSQHAHAAVLGRRLLEASYEP